MRFHRGRDPGILLTLAWADAHHQSSGGFKNLQCALGECLAVEALKTKEIKGLSTSKYCYSTEVVRLFVVGFFFFLFVC